MKEVFFLHLRSGVMALNFTNKEYLSQKFHVNKFLTNSLSKILVLLYQQINE
jgi:hypothetical protein